jgi:hypothetical protein
MEKAAMVSFPLVFFFLHHSQLFSPPHYKLYCNSADGTACPPSVDEGNWIPPPPSPARELCGEGNFPPRHSNYFLTATNCCQSAMPAALPR